MQDFEVRRASLFASLDTAANELGNTLKRNYITHDDERLDIDISDQVEPCPRVPISRGRRSIFLRPEAPINKCLRSRRMPDYQRNPHKWKKYSLVDADDSDVANRVGALMFLQKIAKEKAELEDVDDYDDYDDMDEEEEEPVTNKIAFRKVKQRNELQVENNNDCNADAELDRPQLRGSRLMMPEYVIGQKQQTKANKKNSLATTSRAAGKLTLSHLDEEPDEDDDDEEM